MRMRKLLISISILASLSLPACSIHRADVQQGNVIEQENVDQLKPGITKDQVIFLMGTPLIMDIFRNDRWDYVYTLKTKQRIEKQKLTLFFENDKLVKIEGPFVDPVN
jgi:outer membrane protein assembly factor BamE